MEDKTKKYLTLLYITLLVLINLLLFGFLAKKLFLTLPSNWDPLAFLGSIIGGALTLMGVYWTLNNQKREIFIENYPKKLINLDNSIQFIRKIRDIHAPYLAGTSDKQFEDAQHNGTELINAIVSKSAEVDGISYKLALELKNVFYSAINELSGSKYRTYNYPGESKYSARACEHRLEYSDKYLITEIVKILYKYEEHRNNLERRFNKYLN